MIHTPLNTVSKEVRVRLTEKGRQQLVTNRTKLHRYSEGTFIRRDRRGMAVILVDGYANPSRYDPSFWELIQ